MVSKFCSQEWQGAKRCEATSFHNVCADQKKWKRSLIELLQASDADLIHMLRTDGLLPHWKGHGCMVATGVRREPCRLYSHSAEMLVVAMST